MLFILALTGCSKTKYYSYTYKGENDQWKAEYNLEGSMTELKKDGALDYDCHSTRSVSIDGKTQAFLLKEDD
jgi:hypothetical protein